MAKIANIQFYRGAASGLPTLNDGEPGWTTDTHILYVGQGGVNYPIQGVTDGDKGDVTVSSSGATWTIDTGAVTYAKMQDVSAGSKLLGRGDSGSGDVQEITLGSGLSMSGTTLSSTADASPLTTKGDLYTFDTDNARLPVGTNGQVLVADSGQATGLKWDDISTGAGSPLTTKGDLYTYSTTNTRLAAPAGGDGQFLMSKDAEATGLIWMYPFTDNTSISFHQAVGNTITATIVDGAVTFAKMANLTGPSVVGRAANSTGVPAAITASADGQVLTRSSSILSFAALAISSTTGTLAETRGGTNQTTYTTGDILYASGSNTLSKLAIGTDGQVLAVSGGVPAWSAAGGVSDGDKGDITVSSSGAVWTIDSDTVTDAKLRDSAALSVIGRSANSTGDPADIAAGTDHYVLRRFGTSLGFGPVNLSSINAVTGTLAAVYGGSGQSSFSTGDILYASSSTALSKRTIGTTGQVLTVSGGVPTWATSPSAAGYCEGRLTLTSGTAVTTSDVTGAGTLYFTPYTGNRVSLYDGSSWSIYTFTERSLSLTLTSGKNYDVFLYDNAGTLTLELSAAWTDDTTRADALTTQDGVYVKSGATTRRWLGTIRASGSNTTEDSKAKRLVWNTYNRVAYDDYRNDSTDSWTDNGNGTWSAVNGGGGGAAVWKHEFVRGLSIEPVAAKAAICSAVYYCFAVALDSTSSYDRAKSSAGGHSLSGGVQPTAAEFRDMPSAGYHYVQAIESTVDGTTRTAYGDSGGTVGGGAQAIQSGFITRGFR